MRSHCFYISKHLPLFLAGCFSITLWITENNLVIAQSNDSQLNNRDAANDDSGEVTISSKIPYLKSMSVLELALSEPAFTIGSKAPTLDIEHWISDGEGEYEHTKELKTGRIYVIEFWTTWCVPCVAAMPHLSGLQKRYADNGVQIIGVSGEDLEPIEKFLEKKVQGKEEITYRELIKNYCLTTDPDGSVFKDYFLASQQQGIPRTFIIGREGLLEWIGHPMKMDEPLEKIVCGTWDREAFKKKMESSYRLGPTFTEFVKTIHKVVELAEFGEVDKGLEMIDKAMANPESDDMKSMFVDVRNQILIAFGDRDQTVATLNKIAEEFKDDPDSLGIVINMLYLLHPHRSFSEVVLEAAKEIAEKGAEQGQESFMMQYALGKILHLHGELDGAIEATKKAIDLIDSYKPEEYEELWFAELSDEITKFCEQLEVEN